MKRPEVEAAAAKFLSGYNCSQSVFIAFTPKFGLSEDLALKLSTGLGGGIGRRGELCGALGGGILALGLKYGRGVNDEKPVTAAMYAKVQELVSEFQKCKGAVHCRKLLGGCDLNTPEGQADYRARDLLHQNCLGCVELSAELTAKILD
jgi:C_GCAxxG_C_C family probable redox protein